MWKNTSSGIFCLEFQTNNMNESLKFHSKCTGEFFDWEEGIFEENWAYFVFILWTFPDKELNLD